MRRSLVSGLCAVLVLGVGRGASAQLPPRVDSVDVVGAERTQPTVVVDLTRLSPEERLTARERAVAERRLQLLPTAKSGTLRYVLLPDGRAEVRAIIEEKSALPLDWTDWGGMGVRMVLKDEVKFDAAGLLGRGEVLSGSWRWSTNRPRVVLGVAVPAPGRLPGVIGADALFEELTYANVPTEAADGLFREQRRRVGVQLSDWATPEIRWRAGAALDRLSGVRHVAVEGALDIRLLDDLLAPGVSVALWRPTGAGAGFAVSDVSVAWRSNRRPLPPFAGLIGVTLAGQAAPLALWPAAGTGGTGRGALLRAHPLHEHGIVTSENFARRLLYFTFEHARPLRLGPAGKTALVAFVDAGRAWGGLPGRPRRVNVDVGTGVRFGSDSGMVRLDVGYGLRDRQWAVSAGWVESWPWR